MSSILGEPFQLLLSSKLSQTRYSDRCHAEAIYAAYDPAFPGHATVTAQADGIHLWDLQNIHAVASYSVGEHVSFAAPAFTLRAPDKSVTSYALMVSAPDIFKSHRGRTIWAIRRSLCGASAPASDKTAIVVDDPPVRICGTGHDAVPLLLVSKNGGVSIADARVDIKSKLDWPGERSHLETFVFPRESCSFIQDDKDPCNHVAVICCQAGMTLHVRLVLLGEELVPFGTCEIPIPSSTHPTRIALLGVSCSPSGVLTFVDSQGIWVTYNLVALSSSLLLTPLAENLHLRRFSSTPYQKLSARLGFSIVSLGTSIVLLAAVVRGRREISLQLWDMYYGVVLAVQSMPVPSKLSSPHLNLTVADKGQVLLTVSASQPTAERTELKRSVIYVVPVDARVKSSLAAALGKTALTSEWLAPKSQKSKDDDESTEIIASVQAFLKKNNVQKAEQAFLKWLDSHSSKEAALGHEFVKKIFNIVLPSEPSTAYPYMPRITRCILENAVVSTIMLNGQLITRLRQRGDWENVMFALTTVVDISEDELMASAKFLIDRQCKMENAMDVDASEGYVPPLWSYLFACVSYPFSSAPMRLAIRKHLPGAQDLVVILEILENWIQGGDEHQVEALLKSLAANVAKPSSGADSPPYDRVIAFLQALLDASLVALLQYPPSHDVLRRILSYVEPEVAFIDSLEPLRGVLEPFVKAQMLKEKTAVSKETPAEWRRRRKQLEQRASLGVGLYRLEELAI